MDPNPDYDAGDETGTWHQLVFLIAARSLSTARLSSRVAIRL